MDNAILQAEEFAWTTVVNKKKIQKELKKLRKLAGLEEEAPVTITKASVDVSDEYFVPMIEVPWFPKTSSRRAARKWSQARKSCCVGTGRGLGFFVYGLGSRKSCCVGKYGIEF